MMLESAFCLGDLVYLKTDEDQKKRLITAVTFRATGAIYEVSCGTLTSSHYDFELSTEVNVMITSTN